MWLHAHHLRELGFRRVAAHLWLCRRKQGTGPGVHLSVYDWGGGSRLDLDAFHVTFEVCGERVHFYYREETPGEWVREGRTPWEDMQRLGVDVPRAQTRADEIAARLARALGGVLLDGGRGEDYRCLCRK